jgi:hypothetical protein
LTTIPHIFFSQAIETQKQSARKWGNSAQLQTLANMVFSGQCFPGGGNRTAHYEQRQKGKKHG